jgi:hypothetical protein
MALGLYIIIILAVFIFTVLLIWSRRSHYWLLGGNFLSDDKKIRYRQDKILSYHTRKCLHYLHKESRSLKNNPELAEDILRRLNLLLPSKAILAGQRACLHDILLLLHKKHLAYYTRQSLPPIKGHEKIRALTSSFNLLAAAKNHLKQLDRKAEEQEKKIECLLQLAQNFAAARRTKQFRACIKVAKKFQDSNIRLLKNIHRTEKRLSVIDSNFNSLRNKR